MMEVSIDMHVPTQIQTTDLLKLADEISPDSCRLWDLETDERLDRDRARLSMSEAAEAYQEVARRLGILPESDVVDMHGRSRAN